MTSTGPAYSRTRSSTDGRLVHVVSGSYGAGHDVAARRLALRLRSRGHRVELLDVVDMFPAGLGRLLRAAYFRQLRAAPGSWDWLLGRLEDDGRFRRLVTRALATSAGESLLRAVSGPHVASDLVVATHPFAGQVLGHLRATGRLDVPVATYLTDMSVHPLWVHRGVDLHLALHELPAAAARARGAARAEVVGPFAGTPRRACLDGDERTALRKRLALPPGTLALVTGGSHGIGRLEQAARDIVATGLATPVVLCGENLPLRGRLDRLPDVVALGWRTDVPDLLAAVDCVVQNAGGSTSLESLAAAAPTLSYRCLPGHGETNARALHDAGWVPWARTPDELARLLAAVPTSGSRGTHPAWDRRTTADVVDVLATLLPAPCSLRPPA